MGKKAVSETGEALLALYSAAGQALAASFLIRFLTSPNGRDRAAKEAPNLLRLRDLQSAAPPAVYPLAREANLLPAGTPVPTSCGHSAATWLEVALDVVSDVVWDIGRALELPYGEESSFLTEQTIRENWPKIEAVMAVGWEQSVGNSAIFQGLLAQLDAEQTRTKIWLAENAGSMSAAMTTLKALPPRWQVTYEIAASLCGAGSFTQQDILAEAGQRKMPLHDTDVKESMPVLVRLGLFGLRNGPKNLAIYSAPSSTD